MEIDYLKLAIDEAWKYQFLTYPNPAVGAVVVIKNRVFVSAHKKAATPHAEVNVLWEAFNYFFDTPNLTTSSDIHNYLYRNHNNFFNEATIYVTLEPCNHYGKTPPCSLLIKSIKPKKLFIGWRDLIKGHSGGAKTIQDSGIDVEILDDKRCFELIEPFIKWQNRFIFFKLAFSLNGVYTGGYITKKSSLEWVHKVRDRVDLIVIGGETVRVDRPTLDARLINGKAPDILILSRSKDFDKTIPLFNIPNRKVYVTDNLEILKNYKFIMFEGGENFYQEMKDIIDWKLFMVNLEKIKNGDNFKFNEEYHIIYSRILEDLIIFGR